MDFKVSHTYREGNRCADSLVNLGIIYRQDFTWFNFLPPIISLHFFSK